MITWCSWLSSAPCDLHGHCALCFFQSSTRLHSPKFFQLTSEEVSSTDTKIKLNRCLLAALREPRRTLHPRQDRIAEDLLGLTLGTSRGMKASWIPVPIRMNTFLLAKSGNGTCWRWVERVVSMPADICFSGIMRSRSRIAGCQLMKTRSQLSNTFLVSFAGSLWRWRVHLPHLQCQAVGLVMDLSRLHLTQNRWVQMLSYANDPQGNNM